jgi:hypothetical protein
LGIEALFLRWRTRELGRVLVGRVLVRMVLVSLLQMSLVLLV